MPLPATQLLHQLARGKYVSSCHDHSAVVGSSEDICFSFPHTHRVMKELAFVTLEGRHSVVSVVAQICLLVCPDRHACRQIRPHFSVCEVGALATGHDHPCGLLWLKDALQDSALHPSPQRTFVLTMPITLPDGHHNQAISRLVAHFDSPTISLSLSLSCECFLLGANATCILLFASLLTIMITTSNTSNVTATNSPATLSLMRSGLPSVVLVSVPRTGSRQAHMPSLYCRCPEGTE